MTCLHAVEPQGAQRVNSPQAVEYWPTRQENAIRVAQNSDSQEVSPRITHPINNATSIGYGAYRVSSGLAFKIYGNYFGLSII